MQDVHIFTYPRPISPTRARSIVSNFQKGCAAASTLGKLEACRTATRARCQRSERAARAARRHRSVDHANRVHSTARSFEVFVMFYEPAKNSSDVRIGGNRTFRLRGLAPLSPIAAHAALTFENRAKDSRVISLRLCHWQLQMIAHVSSFVPHSSGRQSGRLLR